MPPENGLRRRTDDPLHYGDPRCAGMTAILLCRKSTATEGRSKSVDEQLEILCEDARRFGFGRTVEILEREGDHGEWWWRDERGLNPAPWREGLTEAVRLVEAGEAHVVGEAAVRGQGRNLREAPRGARGLRRVRAAVPHQRQDAK